MINKYGITTNILIYIVNVVLFLFNGRVDGNIDKRNINIKIGLRTSANT